MGQVIRFLLLFVVLLNWPIGANSDCESELRRPEHRLEVSKECAASFFPNEIWNSAVDMYQMVPSPDPILKDPGIPHRSINKSRTSVPNRIAAKIRNGYTQRLYVMAMDAVREMNKSNVKNLETVARYPWAFAVGTGVHTTFEEYTYDIISLISKKCRT